MYLFSNRLLVNHFCFFVLVFLINIKRSEAQNTIQFDHITTEDGLSQSDINSIYQDDEKFMWFATHEGLNKYDGYNFEIFTPDTRTPNSISSNLIYALTGDEYGNLWIGTTGNGLNHFDKSLEKFTHFVHDDKNLNSLASNHINTLYKDRLNRLWVGTIKGLDLVDLKVPLDEIKFQHFLLNTNNQSNSFGRNTVYAIFEDSENQIWAGGTQGLYKFSKDDFGQFHFKLMNKEIGLPDSTVRSINEDTFGRLIIGTNNGLFILDRNHSTKVDEIYPGFTKNILIENNNIWVGTNSGLLHLDNTGRDTIPKFVNLYAYNPRDPYSLSKNIVKSLYKDHTGVIWVGTNGGGVNKFDPERKQFNHIKKTSNPNSLSYDKIRSIFEDSNGSLWVGTEGGGLNMLPKSESENIYNGFKNYTTIPKPFVTIEIERNNRKLLLIGAEDSPSFYQLDITNPENVEETDIESLDEISGSVFSLLEDKDKNLWIGTYDSGVNRWLYNNQTNSYKKDILSKNRLDSLSISSNIIRNIIEDKNGNIWFATADGLSKLNAKEKYKENPRFDIYRHIPSDENSISHNYILELFENSLGDLWIGTLGGGLNKLVKTKDGKENIFLSYKIEDGLPNNVIKGILEDDKKNLWVSTNKGLSKFNVSNGTFKNYNSNDGLQSNEFQELARLKRKNGELLFGGINGFNSFYPEAIQDNSYEAETVITNLTISNKPIKVGQEINGRVILEQTLTATDEIQLKYKENSFSFEFAALHFAAPGKNNYAYMLEGFNKNWIYTTSENRYATYTNLEPNTYTLKVKASNNDGVWDSSPTEIKIKVIPPFWRTNLAYFIYGLMIIGLLLLFRRFTIIKTTKKHQLELEHLDKEKYEEFQRVKLEFFTNISHELRTPLTLIKGPLKYLQKNDKDISEEVRQEQYGLMQKNSDYLLRLVNQLLDFRKVNQGKMRLVMRKSNIISFIKEVCEPFQFLAHKNQIIFSFDFSDEKIITWFDHDALEKIMNNLLSNAFKFTPQKGEIKIDVSLAKRKPQNKNTEEESTKELYDVIIKVKNSGDVIDEEKLNNIFKRFYTENENVKNNLKGVGIGLSYVKDIVELHQGKIKVKSNKKKGTVFTVNLPFEKEAYLDIPEITCKHKSDSDYKVRTSELDSMAISINDELVDLNLAKEKSSLPVLLVVDDNADIRNFLKQALSERYVIYEADNGKKGFEIANKLLPNVIITDLVMPVMDGIEFCKKVKSNKETSHIPVIMLTAKLSQESEIEGRQIGADGYIRKPFDIELLELKLKNTLDYREKLRNTFNKNITFQPKDVTVTTLDEKFLQQAIEIVEKHMMNTDFSVEMLVKEMGLSRSNIYLKFKEITGLSSSEFIRNIRLKRAVQLFEKSDYSVKEIMYMTGFNTASYFAKCFKKQFGVIPSEYVRQSVKKKETKDEEE
ncbi:hybrid sensor histidine kinase/response regulator [Aquimarina sp. BL5]|uniref:hybrid sensor histidine kinase/response regulator transcription factor n=3 Tax=Aquimarina sp. BL5 TaxID=1714860 RepID=UPI000E4A931F|nr:hybrid sensor histidine kinase/response regulator transcription factor [Aquimarina sp. BL5]AXT50259.1 hybrid sensor histidine kinase/response regulator [Aquimarina sp. BL5]